MSDTEKSLFIAAAWIEGSLVNADRRYFMEAEANKLFLFSPRYGAEPGSKDNNMTMPFSSCTIPFELIER